MIDPVNRRSFLRKTASVGFCASLPGLFSLAAEAAETAGEPARRSLAPHAGNTPGSPLFVISQPTSTDVNPRAGAWSYIEEVLQRGGLFFSVLRPDQLPTIQANPKAIVLLAGQLSLDTAQRELLTHWVTQGGLLMGLGGTSGLDELFGASGGSPAAEGWLKVTAADHPVTRGLRSSLHVFGGWAIKNGAALSLAGLAAANGTLRGSAILEHQPGKGRTLLFAPDLLFSIVHIQQGLPVLQDGKPAPDATAEVNEGTLKAEDGLVLDWQRDRTPVAPDQGPIFLEPITDELRELILRGVFYLATRQGIPLPVLWYWPRALKAVAHMSHDTDGNAPAKGEAMLAAMKRAQLKSTWCTLYPGGYPRDFYRQLTDQGFEIALHYDAYTGGAKTSWSKENFLLQHRWLLNEAGIQKIFSNKNHYTRWEGRLEFLRWCVEAGVEADGTRGPSKKGTIGFPLGGSQPYYPLDDELSSPRRLEVLEINLLSQDQVVTCPPEYGLQLTDSVARHHGVAHFLFHPAHIQKPGVEDALINLVNHARGQGMEWWTSREISGWERARRAVTASFGSRGEFTLRTGASLNDATLLVLRAGPEPARLSINGQSAATAKFSALGFDFDAVTLELKGETRFQVA